MGSSAFNDFLLVEFAFFVVPFGATTRQNLRRCRSVNRETPQRRDNSLIWSTSGDDYMQPITPAAITLAASIIVSASVLAECPAPALPKPGWAVYHAIAKPEGGPEEIGKMALKSLSTATIDGVRCRWFESEYVATECNRHERRKILIPDEAIPGLYRSRTMRYINNRMAIASKIEDPVVRAVKERFEKSGMTLQELGEKMGYAPSVARQAAWQFLHSGDPQVSMLRRFADAMKMSPATLLRD